MPYKPGLQKTWSNLRIGLNFLVKFSPWRDVVVKYMEWLYLNTEARTCSSRNFFRSSTSTEYADHKSFPATESYKLNADFVVQFSMRSMREHFDFPTEISVFSV